MTNSKRALISVSDKEGIVEFATKLENLNFEIISTGGTANLLRKNNIHVKDVSEITGFPEIMNGRVKTLHPKIHGGILNVRSNAEHQEVMKANEILPIDLVIVNLYPFKETISDQESTFENAIENIDIGGPSMVRAAAKNWGDVGVVVDPVDYEQVLSDLNEKGELTRSTKFHLAKRAFALTAAYDVEIVNYLTKRGDDTKPEREFPSVLGYVTNQVQELRYGENPHQKAAFYKWQSAEPVTVANCKQLQGKELSYNNILDADGAIEVTKEFSNEIAVSIIKHTNPCGVGRSDSNLLEAFQKALSCDSTSAFGGIVCVTREVDENLASELEKIFFEIIIAPKFSSEALNILGTKKNLRLLELSGLDKHVVNKQPIFRNVGGGMLAQTPDNKSFDQSECKVVTTREPTDEEWKGLAFAWDVAKHVKSNAIVLANAEQTLGIGAGQMSRVDSARLAATKMMLAKLESKVLCAASDAFYPFRDGIDQLADIGATAIIQPGGSIRDEEVVFAANEHNIAMVFTGVRHFKH